MNGLNYSAESIKEIEGVKIAGTRRDLIYYMIRFPAGSIKDGVRFPGFGDPEEYGYALGATLYTNILKANRVPDTAARWWALSDIRVSRPGANVKDTVTLITSFVFNFSVLRLESERAHDRDRVDLFTAPLLRWPCDEGMGMMVEQGAGRGVFAGNTAPRQLLYVKPIPCAFPIRCELTAGRELSLDEPVDLYVVAHVIYFYPARDKRTERKSRSGMSAPSAVRFSAEVIEQIDGLVESGAVSSKSEFVRNAVDQALERRGGGS